MFEYKNAAYYSDYFRRLSDFSLIEEFKASAEKDEKNLFVGIVEVRSTIHPLVLRVEIPFTFPHNKLVFRTKSLSGYPHLIHTGKIEQGDWFCLNTPFAETVEEQLNQEILRLKGWINRTMNPGLPAIIDDPDVRRALAIAYAYEWENPDEVKEFRAQARLTFVGQDIQLLSSYKEKTGYFYCVKSPDNRIYAYPHKVEGVNFKLPYIIVPDVPGDVSVLEDFLRMKDFYEWDEELCHHLLPDSNYKSGKRLSAWSSAKYEIKYSVDEAIGLINDIVVELNNSESYLEEDNRFSTIFKKQESKKKLVLPSHKVLILEELEKIRKEIIANKGIKYIKAPWNKVIGDDEYDEEDAMIDEWCEYGQYAFHYFVVGFETGAEIQWILFYTNPASVRHEQTSYDIKVKTIYIERFVSLSLNRESPQCITKERFFGRGALNVNFTDKHIALVGLGAIGSMVAEALAHSGVSHIGLWDGDIIEPGNICRSSYRLADLGDSKVDAISKKIQSINPFINISEIKSHGFWNTLRGPNYQEYVAGSFYDNVNYNSQEESLKQLESYDLIIDCTGSNEMLHFLSFAINDKDIISLCITNHANELVCVTNADGNPFELRKAYLSRIEQDTKNFYSEGNGCYSPTFLAKYSDIATLVNICIRDLDKSFICGDKFHSAIFGYCESGILIDRIHTLKLEGYDIILNVPEEALLDAKELYHTMDGNLGYVLGGYSSNGKQILITHIVPAQSAKEELENAFAISKGIIDYLGDFTYSNSESDSFSKEMADSMSCKAADSDINTNNPLLALRTQNGDIVFYLYINNQLVRFNE